MYFVLKPPNQGFLLNWADGLFCLLWVFQSVLREPLLNIHLFEPKNHLQWFISRLVGVWGLCSQSQWTTQESPSVTVQLLCATCLVYIVLTCQSELNERSTLKSWDKSSNKSSQKCLMWKHSQFSEQCQRGCACKRTFHPEKQIMWWERQSSGDVCMQHGYIHWRVTSMSVSAVCSLIKMTLKS